MFAILLPARWKQEGRNRQSGEHIGQHYHLAGQEEPFRLGEGFLPMNLQKVAPYLPSHLAIKLMTSRILKDNLGQAVTKNARSSGMNFMAL